MGFPKVIPVTIGGYPIVSLVDSDGNLLNSSFSVKDYGAIGDGVTDDTAALVAAVTALGTAISTYGNAALVFPYGTYMTDGLVISSLSNFTLKGPGCLKLNRATIAAPSTNTNDVLVLVGCTDFRIEGLEINGNRHTDITWGTTNTDRAPVTQYLQSNAASGQANVAVTNGALFVVGERVWVCGGLTAAATADRNKVDNNSQQGIAIDSINGNTLTLHSNLANSYTATGAAGGAYVTTYQTAVQRSVGAYSLGNEDGQNGFHLLACSKFVITNCYSHDIWESPIKMGMGFTSTDTVILTAACQYGIISNNRFQRGYDQGVSVWNSQNIGVYNNYCQDAGWGGIVLTGSDDCVVMGNIIRDNKYRIPNDNDSGYGFVIEGGARNLFQGNDVIDNWYNNIRLSISPLTFGVTGITLNGNLDWNSTVINVSSGTTFVVGATYMIWDGSKSESVTIASIATNALTITKKTRFWHATGKTIGLRAPEDNTISDNLITGSQNDHGLKCSPAIRTNIKDNSIVRSYKKGILVEQADSYVSGGTIIDGNYFSGNGTGAAAQAILIDNINDVQIINNRISGNFGDVGIEGKGLTNSRIVGNSISDVQAGGIYLQNSDATVCSKIVISNNDVKQCDGAGIKIDRGNHLTIMGNSCWANAGDGGLSLGGLKWSTVKGNICIDNNTNGILLKDDNGVACILNVIEGNVCRDDASSVKGSDGSALTQSVAIKLQDNEATNYVMNNVVDVATAKVAATTFIINDILTTANGLVAGVYTPTRSAESNLDSNATMTEGQYMRVGNTVTVSGRFTADPTAGGAASFEITLPIASNIGAAEDVAGIAFSGAIAGQGAEIIGVVANDTAKIQWIAVDVTSKLWSYTFSYQVI